MGVSESAYYARDIDFTYQYSSFGVPGLGLKRGLSQDLVIAPYATLSPAMVEPNAAVENLEILPVPVDWELTDFMKRSTIREPAAGGEGRRDSASFHGAPSGNVALVAYANALRDGVMRSRFHFEPIVQATGTIAAGADAARDVLVARPRAEEVSATGAGSRTDSTCRAPVPHAARCDSEDATTFEWPLLGDAHAAGSDTAAGAIWRLLGGETPDAVPFLADLHLSSRRARGSWSAGYQPCGSGAGFLRGGLP